MITRSVPVRDAEGIFAIITNDLAVDAPTQSHLAFGVGAFSMPSPYPSRPLRLSPQAAEAAGLPQQFRDYIRSEAERCLWRP